jgi:hypothetical protein
MHARVCAATDEQIGVILWVKISVSDMTASDTFTEGTLKMDNIRICVIPEVSRLYSST